MASTQMRINQEMVRRNRQFQHHSSTARYRQRFDLGSYQVKHHLLDLNLDYDDLLKSIMDLSLNFACFKNATTQ